MRGRACLEDQEIFGVAEVQAWGVTADGSGARLRMTSCMQQQWFSTLAGHWLETSENIDIWVPPKDSDLIGLEEWLGHWDL